MTAKKRVLGRYALGYFSEHPRRLNLSSDSVLQDGGWGRRWVAGAFTRAAGDAYFSTQRTTHGDRE